MPKSPITLVLGASENPERYSYKAARMLKAAGHPLWLTGRRAGELNGDVIHTGFPEPGSIDTVTLYVGPAHQADFAAAVEVLKPRRIIFNPGTENAAWEQHLTQSGIVVEEACTLVLLSTGQY
jgi:uncharacterized protein